jgi:hypothetical protein
LLNPLFIFLVFTPHLGANPLGFFPHDNAVYSSGYTYTPTSFSLEDGAHFLKASPLSNKGFLLKLILATPVAQPGPQPAPIQALLHTF